ncbi:MAG: peptidase M28, partial [Woeseia sp.]|nr:peptidase M28 [Woeseia sp.]
MKTTNHIASLIFAGLLISGCSNEASDEIAEAATEQTAVPESDANTAVTAITDDLMRGYVKELADDKYEGRGPGSRGDDLARQYLISELEQLGLLPGAEDGSWEQPFELVGVTATQPKSWTFTIDASDTTLQQWDDFIVSSGVQAERARISDAELVFVGYGIQAPEYEWDDYKSVDMTGKVAVIVNNDPDWDENLFGGEKRLWYGRWDYKYATAAAQGAVGAIIIHTSPSAGYPFQVVQTSWTGEQFELPAESEPRLQAAAWVTEDSAKTLIEMAALDLDELREAADNRDFKAVPLGITTSLEMDVSLNVVKSANILALMPGSDPELSDEVVIYTAHHDHLGIGT